MKLVTSAERERVLELVRRHGWNATSFQTLEEGYRYFFHAEGCVAYVDTGRAWVVAGAPIAPAAQIVGILEVFLATARRARRRVCLFGTEQRLVNLAAKELRSLCIGEQPVWNPHNWPEILKRRRSLREQLRRALAKAVSVREVTAGELDSGLTREAIARLAERWLKTRAIAPMDFLVRLELCGLFRFLHKRSTGSLTPLAVAVTLDAALTPLQAVLWNLPRARSPLDYALILLACLAPLVASIVLWGARRYRLSED